MKGGTGVDLVEGQTCVVGRLQSCGLQLNEPSSSRKHFEVERHGSRWVLHDLGSRNGSLLNGERVNGRFPLTHGDQIKVGGTVVEFQSAPPCLGVGTSLGNCEVGKLTGRSHVGALYAATQGSLERAVTLEVVDDDLQGDPEFRAAYQARARLAGSFDHPAIQAIYDTSSGDGRLYTVYEACPGPTLHMQMTKAAMDRPQVLSILANVAAALAHVHGRGKHHGGLTPQSIVLSPSGPKLKDLGERQRLAPHRPDRALQARYAAPEEAIGDSVGAEADVYSLGVIAFRLLTGEVPYTGKVKDVLKRHASPEPVPLPDTMTGELRDLLADMLAKAASARPKAAELAERLEAEAERQGSPRKAKGPRKGKGSGRVGKGSARARKGSGRAARPASARSKKKKASADNWGSTSSSAARKGAASSARKGPAKKKLSSSSAANKPALSASSERLRQLAPTRGAGPEPDGGPVLALRLLLLGFGYLLMVAAAAVATRIVLRFV